MVNAAGLIDDHSLGTLRGWVADLHDNYDSDRDVDVAWFLKPKECVLRSHHKSPVLGATEAMLSEQLETLGMAGATLNSTSLRGPFTVGV